MNKAEILLIVFLVGILVGRLIHRPGPRTRYGDHSSKASLPNVNSPPQHVRPPAPPYPPPIHYLVELVRPWDRPTTDK